MYYVMTCEEIQPRNTIGESPDVPGSPWNDGHLIDDAISEPLVYTVDPDYPGSMIPMYDIAELLVRDDLFSSLQHAGVDNLQAFRAVVVDPQTGTRHENYRAVNIVGVVSAAAADESVTIPGDLGFDSLVIDAEKAGNLLMFRLAEAVNAIVVHRSVRERIESDGIEGMTFYEPGEWAG
jgi:hypothetical protein